MSKIFTSLREKSDQFHKHRHCVTHADTHSLLYLSDTFCLTWLAHVLGLGVGVRCVADRGFVGV